jgi:hypothetical protein
MFRALLAHLQEALKKQHLVYLVCVMSFDLPGLDWSSTPILQPRHKTQAIYQVPCVSLLLQMSKKPSKHVEALNS